MTEVEPSVPDEAARSSAASLSERFPDPSARPAIPAEEAELDQFESYHRGPLAGMARLADLADLATTPDPPGSAPETKSARDAIAGEWRKIVAARVGYDVMDPFDTSLEAAAKQMSQPWQPVAKEPVSRVPRDPDLFDQLFPDDHLWTPDPGAKRLRRIVAKAIFEMTAEPLINVGRALTGTLPEEEWPDFVADGLLAALGPGGTAGKPVARGLKKLPMDEANRMARARKQGYAEEPLYRGEASGE